VTNDNISKEIKEVRKEISKLPRLSTADETTASSLPKMPDLGSTPTEETIEEKNLEDETSSFNPN